MDIHVKQRVIGAVVVATLALLLIGFWLLQKEQPVTPPRRYNISLIPTPQVSNNARPQQKEARTMNSPVATQVNAVTLDLPASETEPQPAFIVHSPEHKTVEAQPQKQTTVKTQPTTVSKVSKVKNTSSAVRQVTKKEPAKWAVQLATFSQTRYAKALVKKLKQQKYAVFTHPYVTQEGQALIRVFVGPHTSQKAAQDLQRQLQKRMRLRGLVVRYAPTQQGN